MKDRKVRVVAGPLPDARHVVGILATDAEGQLVLHPVKAEEVDAPGRPRKVRRDVALTLHFEFLTEFEKTKKTAAYDELAKLFGIFGSEKNILSKVQRVRRDVLCGYPRIFMFRGPPRMMATLRNCADGTVEGFACVWGDRAAIYGRGTWTPSPDNPEAIGLNIDQNHPLLTSRFR